MDRQIFVDVTRNVLYNVVVKAVVIYAFGRWLRMRAGAPPGVYRFLLQAVVPHRMSAGTRDALIMSCGAVVLNGMEENTLRGRRGRSESPLIPFAAAFLVVALIAVVYFGGRWLEESGSQPEVRGDHTQRYELEEQIDYKGHKYRRRNQVVSILLMGIDKEAETESGGYRSGGQADFLRLLVLDAEQKKISQFQIDRDTMTPITILGVTGNVSGVRDAQICLAHGFGDGREQSCELTVDAVSNLFFGIPIDFYMALNLDGISVLNDLLGGVTVTLEDDFSALDPAMTPGTTLTLKGEQAEFYTRKRMNIGAGTNESRMIRQEQYIAKLAGMLAARVSEDKEFIGVVYDRLEPYLTTNLSRGRLINEVWAAKGYERAPSVKPEGIHVIADDGFVQFLPDMTNVEPMVIDLFYQELK